MKLDFQTLQVTLPISDSQRETFPVSHLTLQASLKKMIPLKSIPDAERVDAYISAFYEPETGLVQWFRTHYSEYTHKQMTGLANALPLKRKMRSDVLQVLSDLEKERKSAQPS